METNTNRTEIFVKNPSWWEADLLSSAYSALIVDSFFYVNIYDICIYSKFYVHKKLYINPETLFRSVDKTRNMEHSEISRNIKKNETNTQN